MNPTTLNLLAISVFAFTLLSLVGPLLNISPSAVAIALTGIAGIFTVDRFAAQGKGGNLLIDLVSSQSSEYRQRIIHHEAGHFLVAHLLEVPTQSYTLSAWEAIKAGLPGLGGVVLETPRPKLTATTSDDRPNEQPHTLSEQQLNRYCIIGMAGIAAETETFGTATGGENDRRQLKALWQQAKKPERSADMQIRWALLQAQTLLKQQKAAYDALVTAMTERETVEDCCQRIEAHRVADSDVITTSVIKQD